MTFGKAIEALKNGRRVARKGWNGKGMWLAYTGAKTIPSAGFDLLHGSALTLAEVEDLSEIRLGAHIDMRAADGSLVVGWLASQTDMLSDDWETVPFTEKEHRNAEVYGHYIDGTPFPLES